MPTKTNTTLVLLISFFWSVGQAQEQHHSVGPSAASNALNPVAAVIKFQVQPNYSIFSGGGQQINLMTRIIVPYDGIYQPFFKPKNKKYSTMMKFEIPVVSQTYDSASPLNATGLGDITFSEVFARKYSWGKAGVGPCFSRLLMLFSTRVILS